VSETDAGEVGSFPRLEFSLPYDPARLLRARVRLREYLGHLTSDEDSVDEVVLAVMEAATNALRHSGGSGSFHIRLAVENDELVAVVCDDGQGFDPSSINTCETPDLLSVGGRGLFLMTRLMDALEFRFDGGCEVTMRRRLASAPDASPADTPVVER
jgi:serine/threonine-protein kinase RsbW